MATAWLILSGSTGDAELLPNATDQFTIYPILEGSLLGKKEGGETFWSFSFQGNKS